MGNGFLSRVNWNGTLVFMLIRVAFASIGFLLLMAFTGALSQAQGGDVGGSILMVPIVVLILSGMALVAGWLSQQGLPFAGLFALVCSIPMFIGDPMVWLLHKVRPEWVPVAELSFINPTFVWVLNE